MTNLQPLSTNADVVVIGANYGGLVCGGLLAQGGLEVIVIDELAMAGGWGGEVFREGYWIPWGHRDGSGVRDNLYASSGPDLEVARRLGVELPLCEPARPQMRVHEMGTGQVWGFAGSSSGMPSTTDFLDLAGDTESDLLALLDRLRAMPPAEARTLVDVSAGTWFDREQVPPATSAAFLRYLSLLGCKRHPEQISVGRLILGLLNEVYTIHSVNHSAVGGMQGIIEPFAEAFERFGGRLLLRTKPLEVLLSNDRVLGVLAATEESFVREIVAPTVVFARPVWRVFDVIDERWFPAEFAEGARQLRARQSSQLAIYLGLDGLPRRRQDGALDDFSGWNRVFYPDRTFGGGWNIPSIASHRQAPPGKHLLAALRVEHGSYAQLKDKLSVLVEYLDGFYSDLGSKVDWVEHQWYPESSWFEVAFTTGWRPQPQTPIPGFLLCGYTTDTNGTSFALDANSAMVVSEILLAS
jgi:phytoene dehydrogenase-like protein